MMIDVCTKYDIIPYTVFLLAYQEADDHSHDHDMSKHFLDYCKRDNKRDRMVIYKIPQVVEDFLLDVMVGKIVLTKNVKPR